MIGSKIEAVVKEPNENGDVHIETRIDDDIDIYESLAAEVAKMEYKLDKIKRVTLGVSAKNAEDTFYEILGILDE